MQTTITNLQQIAAMLVTIEMQGDAFVRLSPDMRRLLVQATILAQREAERAVNDEFRAEDDERAPLEPCGDCGAIGTHHCPAWCDVPDCDTDSAISSCNQRTR